MWLSDERGEWYSGKELAAIFESFKDSIADLKVEMAETKTLIRDYNGLRKEVGELRTAVRSAAGSKKDIRWWATIGVAIASIIVAVFK